MQSCWEWWRNLPTFTTFYTPEKYLAIQISLETLESLIETVTIVEIVLKVKVEGRIPQWFKCARKGHIRENCSSPLVNNCVKMKAESSPPADTNEKGESESTREERKMAKNRQKRIESQARKRNSPHQNNTEVFFVSLLPASCIPLCPPSDNEKNTYRHTIIPKRPHPVHRGKRLWSLLSNEEWNLVDVNPWMNVKRVDISYCGTVPRSLICVITDLRHSKHLRISYVLGSTGNRCQTHPSISKLFSDITRKNGFGQFNWTKKL